jgi:leucyl/phenylalanyl-tRNA--protein transferase
MFENPRTSVEPNGVVGCSPCLEAGLLKEAYAEGIFPWPQRDGQVRWISPVRRGILHFSEFHVPAKLKRFARRCGWTISFNRCSGEVISACRSTARKGQDFTWITDEIVSAYSILARQGVVHSVECRDEEGLLIGGCYGVWNGRMFTGESMFFRRSNASKLAFAALVIELRRLGVEWIDIQIVSPYMGSVGGKLIERAEFYELLENQPERRLEWPGQVTAAELAANL